MRTITFSCFFTCNSIQSMPKISRRSHLPHEHSLLKRIMLVCGATLLCIAVLAIFWLLSRLGPVRGLLNQPSMGGRMNYRRFWPRAFS